MFTYIWHRKWWMKSKSWCDLQVLFLSVCIARSIVILCCLLKKFFIFFFSGVASKVFWRWWWNWKGRDCEVGGHRIDWCIVVRLAAYLIWYHCFAAPYMILHRKNTDDFMRSNHWLEITIAVNAQQYAIFSYVQSHNLMFMGKNWPLELEVCEILIFGNGIWGNFCFWLMACSASVPNDIFWVKYITFSHLFACFFILLPCLASHFYFKNCQEKWLEISHN